MRAVKAAAAAEPDLFARLARVRPLRSVSGPPEADPAPVLSHGELFRGPALGEVAAAARDASDPRDPASVFAAFLANVMRGGRRSGQPGPGVPAELRGNPAIPDVVKRLFDYYFRVDLYGTQIHRNPIVLSSGSYDETEFGLPESLKDCIRFSLSQNWYGYSDSLGRGSTRTALAALESVRYPSHEAVGSDNVAVTLGGTAAIASVADLLSLTAPAPERRALVCVPNYPPLVAAIGQRFEVELVATGLAGDGVDITEVISRLSGGPRMILLQTVMNPWGRRIREADLARLIAALPEDCYLVLDECHDAFGPAVPLTPMRRRGNVISIRGMSKLWAAPGLKAGWLVADQAFIDAFYTHASTTYGGPPSLLYLLLEMFALFERVRLTGQDSLRDCGTYLRTEYGLSRARVESGLADYLETAHHMQREVRRRREHTVRRLFDAGIGALAPEYSINVFAKLGDLPSYNLYRRLIGEAGVSVYPGVLCMSDTTGTARISPCVPDRVLDAGLDRIIAWHAAAAR
jgi:aspartate/methionine/tyrosine aminotransferase